jgi:hypothetical protein
MLGAGSSSHGAHPLPDRPGYILDTNGTDMKTFTRWFRKKVSEGTSTGREGAKPVVGTGLATALGGGFGLAFVGEYGSPGGVTTQIRPDGLTNTNIRDEQGRRYWQVTTQNTVYLVAMDDATAKAVAHAFYLWRSGRASGCVRNAGGVKAN